jgi:hypothetical protein
LFTECGPREPNVPAKYVPLEKVGLAPTFFLQMCDARAMPQLVVTEKIDGNPVAWRCSACKQGFSARGKLTSQERLEKVTGEFKAHIEESHKGESSRPMAFAAGVPLPD